MAVEIDQPEVFAAAEKHSRWPSAEAVEDRVSEQDLVKGEHMKTGTAAQEGDSGTHPSEDEGHLVVGQRRTAEAVGSLHERKSTENVGHACRESYFDGQMEK